MQKEREKPTELETNIGRADQDFDLILDLKVMFSTLPEAFVFFGKLRFVRGREVGIDIA